MNVVSAGSAFPLQGSQGQNSPLPSRMSWFPVASPPLALLKGLATLVAFSLDLAELDLFFHHVCVWFLGCPTSFKSACTSTVSNKALGAYNQGQFLVAWWLFPLLVGTSCGQTHRGMLLFPGSTNAAEIAADLSASALSDDLLEMWLQCDDSSEVTYI